MSIKQISIFLENKAGRLYEVSSALGDANIDIHALSLADTSDFGILRLIVNQPEKASTTLKEKGFTVGITEVIAVEVEDKPGGFAKVMKIMQDAKINIEYMYAFVEKTKDNAIVIFRVDNIETAINTLEKKGLHILREAEVLDL
ncbi:MAG: ACT domain-containing protein [Spirochaetes bacterium]|nr:ACT domain-containing protein [Spirochaetota bacterium]MCK5267741.1 ACT domain-containing protein [Spirochaetota bacterium]